jgi:Cu/Ag efflux protein CusF
MHARNGTGLHRNRTMMVVGIAITLNAHGVCAQTTPQRSPAVAAEAGASILVDAEVRKVDKDAGKITLRHAPIPNLDMPTMTMVFRVKDPAMLDQVQAGDKVRFAADKIGGQYTIMAIEVVK